MTKPAPSHTEFDEDYEITQTMIIYGGGFVSRLGALWRQADAANKERLKTAFPDYWRQYRDYAAIRKQAIRQGPLP